MVNFPCAAGLAPDEGRLCLLRQPDQLARSASVSEGNLKKRSF
jgi:hypothetical protein